jgi:hypothetical protein
MGESNESLKESNESLKESNESLRERDGIASGFCLCCGFQWEQVSLTYELFSNMGLVMDESI